MKIGRLPLDDKTNGWSAILPTRMPKPLLVGDVTVDWVVLGAGYAGLAAARQLTEDERNTYGVKKPWGLTPANVFVGITMGYTIDHRIVIRHSLHYCANQRVLASEQAAAKHRHKELFDKRFPMLSAVDMEHTWSDFSAYRKTARRVSAN